MEISLRARRSREVAGLLVLGTGLALLGLVVVSASVPDGADAGTRAGAWGGALLALAGYVLVLIALARWVLRTRRTSRAAVRRSPAAAGV